MSDGRMERAGEVASQLSPCVRPIRTCGAGSTRQSGSSCCSASRWPSLPPSATCRTSTGTCTPAGSRSACSASACSPSTARSSGGGSCSRLARGCRRAAARRSGARRPSAATCRRACCCRSCAWRWRSATGSARGPVGEFAYELVLTLTGSALVGAYLIIDLPALRDDPQRFLALGLPILALVALHPSIFHRLANFALGRLGRPQLERALDLGDAAGFAALYAVDFVSAGLSVYALAHLAYPVTTDDVPIVIGAFAASNVLSLLAFVLPSGIVAREAALVLALSPIMPR